MVYKKRGPAPRKRRASHNEKGDSRVSFFRENVKSYYDGRFPLESILSPFERRAFGLIHGTVKIEVDIKDGALTGVDVTGGGQYA